MNYTLRKVIHELYLAESNNGRFRCAAAELRRTSACGGGGRDPEA